MLRAYAYLFGAWIDRLDQYEMQLNYRVDREGAATAIGDADVGFVVNWLEPLRLECVALNLDVAIRQISDFDQVRPQTRLGDLRVRVASLRRVLLHHLEGRQFLYVTPSQAEYFQPLLFGLEVAERFPEAMDDVEAAGRCLALGQGTACVFHLMRVMEVGLRALAKKLKIPYAPSWEQYLRQIAEKIYQKPKLKTVIWKRDEPVYRDIHGDLQAVKLAWRNPTMHVQRSYAAEQAGEIYAAVKRFMQDLAVKLPTTKATR
jgi:hypothetical protein